MAPTYFFFFFYFVPPELTLHVLPPSHPCMTAEAALGLKGLEYERVDLSPGAHIEEMEEIYGEGNSDRPRDARRRRAGPRLARDPRAARGARARARRSTPSPIADAVREAERWGDEELQDLGRRLPWGAMHFRPEAMGTFGGGGALDPAGTDFAISYVRATWKYHGITCRAARRGPRRAAGEARPRSTRSPPTA